MMRCGSICFLQLSSPCLFRSGCPTVFTCTNTIKVILKQCKRHTERALRYSISGCLPWLPLTPICSTRSLQAKCTGIFSRLHHSLGKSWNTFKYWHILTVHLLFLVHPPQFQFPIPSWFSYNRIKNSNNCPRSFLSMSFAVFWYEALPFKISCYRDELWKHSWHSSCLSYFPWCLRKGLYLVSSQRQGFWDGNSRLSVLHSLRTIFLVVLICLNSSGVVRDYCSLALERRGELEFIVKQTYLRLWLLNSPVQMQRSSKLHYPDPTECLCRARAQLESSSPFSVSLRYSFNRRCGHWYVGVIVSRWTRLASSPALY